MYCPKCIKEYRKKRGRPLSPTVLPTAAREAQGGGHYCSKHGCRCVPASDIEIELTQVCIHNNEMHIVDEKYCSEHGQKAQTVKMSLEKAIIIVKAYLGKKMASWR